jgi:hypothetical protein
VNDPTPIETDNTPRPEDGPQDVTQDPDADLTDGPSL